MGDERKEAPNRLTLDLKRNKGHHTTQFRGRRRWHIKIP